MTWCLQMVGKQSTMHDPFISYVGYMKNKDLPFGAYYHSLLVHMIRVHFLCCFYDLLSQAGPCVNQLLHRLRLILLKVGLDTFIPSYLTQKWSIFLNTAPLTCRTFLNLYEENHVQNLRSLRSTLERFRSH